LHFLDSKINTKLLVVLSCYAGGVNANKIYGEIKLGTQKYFSFPIIIQTLNNVEALFFSAVVDMSAYVNNEIKLITDINFVDFFQKAKRMEGNYSKIIRSITNIENVQNTPQIKLPGTEWFSVIELDKKIVSIGSMLAKTRDPQKSLDIVSFFNKKPEIILLYTDNIPFELVVETPTVKYIISMVSPHAIMPIFVRIKKISSSQNFSDIIYWFGSLIYTHGFTHFCIDEIGNKKNIIISRAYDGGLVVYYEEDEVVYIKKLTKDALLAKSVGLGDSSLLQVVSQASLEWVSYKDLIRQRDEYSRLSEQREMAKGEISSEQIQQIKNIQQEKIKKQKEIVSSSSVD
jgi:hypothetical protein